MWTDAGPTEASSAGFHITYTTSFERVLIRQFASREMNGDQRVLPLRMLLERATTARSYVSNGFSSALGP